MNRFLVSSEIVCYSRVSVAWNEKYEMSPTDQQMTLYNHVGTEPVNMFSASNE